MDPADTGISGTTPDENEVSNSAASMILAALTKPFCLVWDPLI